MNRRDFLRTSAATFSGAVAASVVGFQPATKIVDKVTDVESRIPVGS